MTTVNTCSNPRRKSVWRRANNGPPDGVFTAVVPQLTDRKNNSRNNHLEATVNVDYVVALAAIYGHRSLPVRTVGSRLGALLNTEVAMSRIETQSMTREQFLTISVNLLHRAFIEATRTDAKNLFKAISDGQRVALTNVEMADKATVRFDLGLDHSEYEGSLNFGAFRASLTALLGKLASAIKAKEEIVTFGAEGDAENVIYGVTGVTVERNVPSVMVLSSHTGGKEPAILLRLMYLDYQQFLASQQEDAGDTA